MIPWSPWCLKVVGGTLSVLCISPPNCFNLAHHILGYLLPVTWNLFFPRCRQNCTSWSIILMRAWSSDLISPLASFFHVFIWDEDQLMTSSNQPLFRIGSVGWSGNGGGGASESTNIYIVVCENKERHLLLQLVAKEVSCLHGWRWYEISGLQLSGQRQAVC